MKEILRTNSLTQAVSLQTALQAAGIQAALQGEHSLAITGGGLSVVVLDDEALERARIILHGIDALPHSAPRLHRPHDEIVREYERRRVNHDWTSLLTLVYLVTVLAAAGLSTSVRVLLILTGVIVSTLIQVRTWRCPNCNRSLGRFFWWQWRCPHCYVSFRRDRGSAA